jgi:hypothetical protein
MPPDAKRRPVGTGGASSSYVSGRHPEHTPHQYLAADGPMHLGEAAARLDAAAGTLAQLELGLLDDNCIASVIRMLDVADRHLKAVLS